MCVSSKRIPSVGAVDLAGDGGASKNISSPTEKAGGRGVGNRIVVMLCWLGREMWHFQTYRRKPDTLSGSTQVTLCSS